MSFLGMAFAEPYTGKPISLNFQDIPIHSALKNIAEFTGLNVVVSEEVTGTVTLNLSQVPSLQALDTLLILKGLEKQTLGNVLWIRPKPVNAEGEVQGDRLTHLIPIHYANAEEMASLLRSKDNTFLSKNGVLSFDTRTNTLIVQDVPSKVTQLEEMIKKLDVLVPQVLIEARILVINSDFSEELGLRLGASAKHADLSTSGTLEGARKLDPAFQGKDAASNPSQLSLNERLNLNLPLAQKGGTLGFTFSTLPANVLLDLELSAVENEGKGEIISRPRLLASNQREAIIESGEEIPYQTSKTHKGYLVFSTFFKKAVLSLKVTPQVTPGRRVLLQLTVNQDNRGKNTDAGPAIDTQKIQTQVLVKNGETLVLGGIYQHTKKDAVSRVPGFGKLPVIGRLFRNTSGLENKKELLIFVTPKIIEETQ
ncbi:MAG: type IV pilus secretin PilQ [Gammaproteobacteria bacterium]|nr:type IV pilus secretin PilQ [Gammaproteobacteria bacterium]